MRPRRAVLQISQESFVAPGLLFHKISYHLTPSESTLLQVLIPLHFNSSRMNTYKKPGRGSPSATPKFYNSSIRVHRRCAHTATPANLISSFTCAHLPSPPGWGCTACFPLPCPQAHATKGDWGRMDFPLAYRGEFGYLGLGNRGELPTA